MTAEQLAEARRRHWRQNKNPLLVSDDVRAWIDLHPLSLFLPRRAQLPAPGPSLVEAVEGEANATPPLAAAERATDLLAGLIESGAVIPLNLLGGAGEQPDFLAQAEILPFVAALRGDRDWKQPPASAGGRHVSPLMLELWSLLERSGPMTAAAAREALGRELTEPAVLRALDELWQRLRAIPILQTAGKPAVWELLKHRHSKALATGSGTSQVTAISLLVSTYLQSVYAASSEAIEIFLSPLVSRSRIREAVRGLSATRQIQSLSMESQTYYFLEGGLPEFAPAAESEAAELERQRPAAPSRGTIAAAPSFAPRAPRTPRPTRTQSGFQSQSQGRNPGGPGNWSKGSGTSRPGNRPGTNSMRRFADASRARHEGRSNDRVEGRTKPHGGAERPREGGWKQRPAAWSRRPESGQPGTRQEGNRPNITGKETRPHESAAPGSAKWKRFSDRRPPGKPPAQNAIEGSRATEGRDRNRGGARAWKSRRDFGPRTMQEGRPGARPGGGPGRPGRDTRGGGTRGGGTRGGFDSRKPRTTEQHPLSRGAEKRYPAQRNSQGETRPPAKTGRPRFSNPRFAGPGHERSSRPNPGRFGNRGAGPRNEGASDLRPERRPWKNRPVPGEPAPGKPGPGRSSTGRPGAADRPGTRGPQSRKPAGSFRPDRQKPDSRKPAGQKAGFRKTGAENRGTRAGGGGGFRDKKPQASFPGKKWPKKKPEA